MKMNPFTSLKFPNFRYLWIGSLISTMGNQMQIVSAIWQVYQLSHSPMSLGFIGAARIVPYLIFSPFAGVSADVFNRRKLMFVTQSISIILTTVLLLLTVSGTIHAWMIYAIIGLQAAVNAFDQPAKQSLIPLLLPKKYLFNAFSLNILQWQSSSLLGPAIAGFMIAFKGVSSIYLINLLTFFVLIIALFFIHPAKQVFEKTASISWSSFVEGLSFIKKSSVLISTMVLDFVATFLASATTLLPIYADRILHVGPQGLGFLYAAPSLGAVIFGPLYSSFGQVRHSGKILLISIIIFGIATLAFGLSQNFFFSILALVVLGGSDAISTIIRNGIRQIGTPDYIRGRVSSVASMFAGGGPQLGEIEAGLTATLLGVQLSVALGGVATVAVTLLVYKLVPHLRSYHGESFEEKK